MIEHTFIILQGIGSITERKLWQEGVLTWEDFISTRRIRRISSERKRNYDNTLMKAAVNLENGNSAYFSRCLDAKEHWRLYEKWKDEACFLDIETKGLQHGITVVGIYSKEGYTHYVRGINLIRESLEEELNKYSMLVTFYGRAFDMPFIERELGIRVDSPHLDLCFAGKKIGLKGGLKNVEQHIGIEREGDIKGLNGFDAVQLWNDYKRGDKDALNTLIRYNEADTVNLKILADFIYDTLKEKTFLSLTESCNPLSDP
ncbi:MAG: ribonuclease H-like domain-containing protein [Theionarchaea archaeon]|nr:ribonuclease H-like domain-containing protein [Theionarchaea archaeon]